MTSYRLAATVLAMVGVALTATEARSAVRPEVQAAAEAYADLRYDEARTGAEELLRAGGNTFDELVVLYRVLGEVYAARGERKKTALHLDKLLALDPDAAADEMASPKISSAYDAARKRWDEAGTFAIDHEPPEDLVDGGITLRFAITNDPFDYVKAVVVRYRAVGETVYKTAEGSDIEEVVMALSAADLGPDARAVEYFAVAVDEHTSALREWGSQDAPIVVPPEAARPVKVTPDTPMTWEVPGVTSDPVGVEPGKGRKALLWGMAMGGATALGISILVALLTQPTPRTVEVVTSVRAVR